LDMLFVLLFSLLYARKAMPKMNGTPKLRRRLTKVMISDLRLRELLLHLHDLHVCREVLHGPQ